MSCTQEELLQVMQKLISERQKVKALERRLEKGATAEAITLPPTVPQEQEKEIEVLKNIVQELREKVKTIQAPLATPPPATDEGSLKQSLSSSQKELRHQKERCIELEEELHRSVQFRTTLQAELKEQHAKTHELETRCKELTGQKARVSELEAAKHADAKGAAGDIVTKNLYLEEHERRRRLEEELEEQKKLVLEGKRQIEEFEAQTKKRLEEASSAISCHENQKLSLAEENRTYLKSIESLRGVLEDQKKQIDLLEGEKKQRQLELSEIRENLRESENRGQKLRHDLERAEKRLAEEEAKGDGLRLAEKNLLAEKEELRHEIGELEQHLARRVKECTERTSACSEHEQLLTAQAEKIKTLSSEYSTTHEQYEELYKLHQSLSEEFKTRETRLADLERVAEQYRALTTLFEQGAHIISEQALPRVRTQKTTYTMSSDLARALHYDTFQ